MQALIDMAECVVMCTSIIMALIWYATSEASLPSIRITSETCSLTATLVVKDNLSSDATDALLSDNSSNSQETFVKGWRVHF